MGIFFAGIEFLASVDVLAAGVAPHAEGGHETDRLLAVVAFAGAPARELAWIEVRGIVLAQHLSFGHGDKVTSGLQVSGGDVWYLSD